MLETVYTIIILFECNYGQETRTLTWKDVECADSVQLGSKIDLGQ